IVADPVAEYERHVPDAPRRGDRVATHYHQVGFLARRYRTGAVGYSQDLRAVRGHDLHRLFGGEAGFDQQLVIALVAVARDFTQAARIRARPEKSSGFHELALELHRFLEREPGNGILPELRAVVVRLDLRGVVGRERVQDPLVARYPGRAADLEDRERGGHRGPV